MKRILKLIDKIPEEFHLSRREFLLTIAVSALGGVVFGMLKSPHRTQIIGCGNGNGTWNQKTDESVVEDEVKGAMDEVKKEIKEN
ncbi:MAG: hypothetical protein MR016_00905 [Agathobacter sp.]|nr:hypothetical protein [Agathobacter sp.]